MWDAEEDAEEERGFVGLVWVRDLLMHTPKCGVWYRRVWWVVFALRVVCHHPHIHVGPFPPAF